MKPFKIYKTLIFSLLLSFFLSGCQSELKEGQENGIYNSAHKLKDNMKFLPLKPGAIKPEGWLNDWAQKAASGITGHLDQHATTFEKGWSGETFEARGVKEEGTNWPLEQSAYWLDGLVRLAWILEDPALKQKVKSRLDPIVEGVINGGPSFIHWRPVDQLERPFDNWAHSHMGRAMVAYYMATGEQRILDALVKVYQGYMLPDLPANFIVVSGSVNVDPMLDTYLLSGDTTILHDLQAYTRKNEIEKTVSQWINGDITAGHTVIYYENIRVPSVLHVLTGESKFIQATKSAFDWGEREHGLPLGLISGEEYSAGIGSIRNVETCNVAAGAWTINWLMRITGDGKYGDRLEDIFFNAGPAPIDKDFKTMCYYQSPNRISTEFPEDEPMHPGKDSYLFTEIGHTVLCCVGNSNRIIPNYIMHMWMKPVSETGIAATLYGPSTLKTEINRTMVSIQTITTYPFEENIRMLVDPEKKVEFALYLRIPEWSTNSVIKVNGEEVKVEVDQNGFCSINRTWKKGDEVNILFPMTIKLLTGTTNDYPEINYFKKRDDARRLAKASGINAPFASVKYGPLLFALPIPDDGPNQVKTIVPYNYALSIDSKNPDDKVEINRRPLPEKWEWTLENAPLTLTVPALQFNWEPEELHPLPDSTVKEGKDVKIDLVPYGNTKFRVSMFPVSSATWRSVN